MTTDIEIMTYLQKMHLRPGMFIGDTEDNEVLCKELVDNAVDELLCGFATRIDIDWNEEEGWFRVCDNGRGMPLDEFHTTNPELSYLNGGTKAMLLFMQPDSSGKYSKANYAYSSGTNGVGLKACNVFSKKTVVQIIDPKSEDIFKFVLGWDAKRTQIVKAEWLNIKPENDLWWSTEITIWPDDEVFRNIVFKVRETQLQLAKSTKPEATINVQGAPVEAFDFKLSVGTPLFKESVFDVEFRYGTLQLEIQFGWSADDFKTVARGAVNLGTCNDGYHVKESKTAIGRAVASFNSILLPSDADYGLRVFVNALVSEPNYNSQTKEKMSSIADFDTANDALVRSKYADQITIDPDTKSENLKGARIAAKSDLEWLSSSKMSDALTDKIRQTLESDESYLFLLISRIIEYKKQIQNLSEQNFIASLIKNGSDRIGKHAVEGIVEATSPERDKCELYICEGASAGSPIKGTRDRMYQAVMELRGKPQNVANVTDIKDVVENPEIRTMINGIGVGMRNHVDMTHRRYGKIIIATDADADGKHIQGLIIGALAFLVPQVLSAGMVYLAVAPLYKQGEKFFYSEKGVDFNKKVKRYKGLGSMLEADLGKTLVSPKTRILQQITMSENGQAAIVDIVTSSREKKRLMVRNDLLNEEL